MENSKGLASHQYKILILPQAFSTRHTGKNTVSNAALQAGFLARTEHCSIPKTVPFYLFITLFADPAVPVSLQEFSSLSLKHS